MWKVPSSFLRSGPDLADLVCEPVDGTFPSLSVCINLSLRTKARAKLKSPGLELNRPFVPSWVMLSLASEPVGASGQQCTEVFYHAGPVFNSDPWWQPTEKTTPVCPPGFCMLQRLPASWEFVEKEGRGHDSAIVWTTVWMSPKDPCMWG